MQEFDKKLRTIRRRGDHFCAILHWWRCVQQFKRISFQTLIRQKWQYSYSSANSWCYSKRHFYRYLCVKPRAGIAFDWESTYTSWNSLWWICCKSCWWKSEWHKHGIHGDEHLRAISEYRKHLSDFKFRHRGRTKMVFSSNEDVYGIRVHQR